MRSKKFILPALFSILLAVSGISLLPKNESSALSGSQFKAGNIIADSLFYTGSAMSTDQIKSFLNNKVPNCDTNGEKMIYDSKYGDTVTRKKYSQRRGVSTPFICLKNYSKSTSSVSANAQCSAYSGGTKSAAKIIHDISKACKISQKVLLVLLEKEQSLVSDDWPWPIQYKKATGYGCPDTSGCDSTYYGFFNQVYNAARQFNRYKQNPEDYGHLPYRTNSVRYNPKSSCGSKSVSISNFATAGLYNYTPYTPNKAALDNLYGTGNSCSAYGNRNFWRMYNDWFGSSYKEINYRLIECSGEKYMVEIWKHRKRPLTNNAIREFGFQDIQFITDDSACDYDEYSAALDTIARSRKTGNAYMLNSGSFHYLQSESIGEAWGYENIYDESSQIPQLDGETLNDFTVLSSTPRLAKSSNTGKVYLIDDGEIYHLSGTPSNTDTLKLVRGDDEIPMGTFSGEHLSYLKATNGEGTPIRASFQIDDGSWYLFDSAKVRKVSQKYYPNRWNLAGIFDGPTLSVDVAKSMNPTKGIGKGFKWSNKTYYVVSEGGDLLSTKKFSTAYRWGVTKNPRISTLLRVEIEQTN